MKKRLIFIALFALLFVFAFGCKDKNNGGDDGKEEPKLSVTFSNPLTEMFVGDSQTITYEAKNGTATVTFESSDSSVLSVDNNGVLNALKVGSATIKCDVKEDSSLSKSFTINVKEKEVTKYTYKFIVEGKVVKEETLPAGSDIVAPADPTKDATAQYSYTFKGWDKPVGKLTEDVEFNAVFEEKVNEYTLTLNVDGEKTTKKYEYGTVVTLEDPNKAKEGFTFKGWALGDGTAVESVTLTGDLEVFALFEAQQFDLHFNLDGGTCDNLPEKAEYGTTLNLPTPTKDGFRFLGWKLDGGADYITSLDITKEETLVAFWEEIIFTITYQLNGGTCEGLVETAKPGTEITLPTTVAKDGYDFLGWKFKGEFVTKITVTADCVVSAKFEAKKYTIEYVLDGGVLLEENNGVRLGGNLTLPVAYKNGALFQGWKEEGNPNYVTEITNANQNYKFTAVWEVVDIAYVGEGLYATFDEALAAVSDGGEVCFMPGTYEGIKITKDITVSSLNKGLNPSLTTFKDEAIFTQDVEVLTSGVTVDGLTLTEKARLHVTGDVNNINLKNIRVFGSTVNPSASDSNTAPFYLFAGGNGNVIKDITIEQCLIEQRDTGRPMILYGYDIENLTIKNSCFYGGTVVSNYNDGIKIANPSDTVATGCAFGIKGNVNITGNTFTNYSQYVIWFRGFAEGNYNVVNNIFLNCGQTAANHACVTMITYTGAADGEGSVNVNYNYCDNSYMLIRMDNSIATFTGNAHYNVVANSNGDYYIKNKGTCEIDASYNFFNGATPEASKFLGVKTYENNYATAAEVPAIGENTGATHSIIYDLNGGDWEATKLTIDDTIELLLAALTEYYGEEVTKDNVHVVSEASTTPRMFNFFEKAEWTWLRDYMIYCRTNDATQSAGVAHLNTTSEYANTYWRYEVAGFVNKKAWESWPYSSDYSSLAFKDYFEEIAILGNKKEGPTEFVYGMGVNLVTPAREGYAFDGWKDGDGNIFAGVPFWVDQDLSLTASWSSAVAPEEFAILNDLEDGIELFAKVQLEWEFTPSDTYNKRVSFQSSDESIFTVDRDGLICALKAGTAKLIVKVDADSNLNQEIIIRVYKPDHFEISYETESYVKENETIKLNSKYIRSDNSTAELTWTSFSQSVATVDENGVVTGVSEGDTTIRCALKDNSEVYVDFGVSVLPNRISDVLQYVLDAHNSNIFVRYNLGIGAGTPSYYMDILGSITDVLYNQALTINTKYEATQAGVDSNHGGEKSSTEFITVHYTGNMAKGATAAANAQYFATGGGGTSIHYVTGNDGVYHVLDDKLVGFHAGDGTKVEFTWTKTGVMQEEGDPLFPVWGINSDSYFTINGKATSIPVPEGTTAATKKVTSARWINNMGLPFKVVDGEYYMGTTYWCYTQVAEGRICSHGGNLNSIGIESAVNEGTDLWYTWHKTAQLVAKLMVENDLDITRVVGHHFFSAKDCPQPMLENDLEIWYVFRGMVELEYRLLTEFSNYEFKLTLLDAPSCVNSYGRVTEPENAVTVTYELEIKNKTTGAIESIVLSSAINGQYAK